MLAKLRSYRPSHAVVVAYLALFVALGGSSYAALTVTGKNVKNSSLTGKDVKNSSLTSSDVKNRSLLAADFKPGQLPRGPQGATGATGTPGTPGTSGIIGLEKVTGDSGAADSTSSKSASAECPAGKQVIAAGYDVTGGKTGGSPDEKLDIAPDHISVPAPDSSSQHQYVDVVAYEVTGTVQNWSVQAMALCANVSP